MENRAPFVLRLQVNEIFRVTEASCVRTVVGRSGLRHHRGNFRKRRENESRLIGKSCALCVAGAVGKRSARPDGAFVQMRQKLRADDPAEGQKNRNDEGSDSDTHCEDPMLDCPAKRPAISIREESQYRIPPLLDLAAEKQTCQHWSDQDGESHGTEQRERYGPGHGLEEVAFHPLKRKYGHVGSDDDQDGVENRTLNLVAGLSN